ncbi:hypothetical protein [Cryptosporangium phraense]|uniref:FtsH ternary system domain-containing protein n=1 Tax=Cryptosporangium phraense TaxID=2593070 RepID=A0A545AZM3_9ACTN|nr:hypothetical protein [Cryptosporangium phraense]TQS46754.1 hypothetical protein FL583_00285 [Cryptosporangium phraense]
MSDPFSRQVEPIPADQLPSRASGRTAPDDPSDDGYEVDDYQFDDEARAEEPGSRAADPVPAPVVDLAGRFGSASAALIYLGQARAAGYGSDVRILRPASGPAWWVAGTLPLDLGRELVAAVGGRAYVESGGRLWPDTGWGPPPAPGAARGGLDLGTLTDADLTELVRVAGLRAVALGVAPAEAIVLLRGEHASGLVQRALELGLSVSHQLVRLEPLFEGPPTGRQGAVARTTTLTAMRLTAGKGTLPPSLLVALANDPFVTVCRVAVGGRLLVEAGFASPLPDDQLAALVDTDAWLLAGPGAGCARLTWIGEASDAAGLARLADDYPLTPASGSDDPPVHLSVPAVRIVPARAHGIPVDAVLLEGDDLETLPALLEGHPLADIAILVQGRDRHLLTAAGGLLERLAIGEPLRAVGPGPLYVPIGYRFRPRIPAAARRRLFGQDERTAVVALPEGAVAFDLSRHEPVWTLWVGPLPDIDPQLPVEAIETLAAIEVELTPELPKPAPPKEPPTAGRRARDWIARLAGRGQREASERRSWRDEAWDAEVAGNLPAAAELFSRHGEPLRAAHLYERAALEADRFRR